ncbi:CRISPR system precrRNA processing endoribonuclease RAMP protein Cas6 [Candidatus Chlorohelix sp.]|uniref:CRISPR system precrRNA processing endoribonuclease RAMP protein Cas6 n=1 Tax=Candidatus Chlorohelix sp. TaxID=3139201 RepID=UPI00304A369C
MVSEVAAPTEFSAQVFEFRFEVAERVVLNQHKGAALRGALFHAIRKVGCSCLELTSCRPCPLVEACPVSFLLATVDDDGKRGGDVPRPFVINPPLEAKNIYEVGDTFNFGLTLFARSVKFLPYLVVGLQQMEREGLGVKYESSPGRWRRGSLRLRNIAALNPLSGEEQILFKIGNRAIEAPNKPTTHSEVLAITKSNGADQVYKLRFNFLTPTRLIKEGKPLSRPDLPILTQRLVERLSSLSSEYGKHELVLDYDSLLREASEMTLVEDRTYWGEVRSYSNRQQQDLSLSGFMGEVTYLGRAGKLIPLLLWGQLTHVGKDATKGNGWYSLIAKELSQS